jgi:hypothetical protein
MPRMPYSKGTGHLGGVRGDAAWYTHENVVGIKLNEWKISTWDCAAIFCNSRYCSHRV